MGAIYYVFVTKFFSFCHISFVCIDVTMLDQVHDVDTVLCFMLAANSIWKSWCNLFSFVVYLYINSSGSTTSVGEERASLSAVVYL